MNPNRLRHLKNASWSVAEGVGYPLLLLGATPLLLSSLGPGNFGLWMLLITITSTGMVVGIGLSPAVIKLVAQYSGEAPQRLAETVRGAVAVAVLSGCLFGLLVLLLTVVGANSWLSRMGSPSMIIATGLFSAVILWIEQLDLVVSSVIKGFEDFSLAARLEIGMKLAQVSLLIVTAVVTHALLPVFTVFLAMAAIRLLVKARFLLQSCPGLSLRPDWRHASPVLLISKWGWLQGLGSVCFLSGDRLIVGAALGAASLGYYSIAVQLVSQLHAFIANAFSIIVPRVSRLSTAPDAGAALRDTANKLIALNIAAVVLGVVMVWFAGPPFLDFWVGHEVASQVAPAFTVLVAVYAVLSLSIAPFHVLTGLGEVRVIAWVLVFGGALTLVLTFVLVPDHGIAGAALGRGAYAACALLLFIPAFLAFRRSAAVQSTAQAASRPHSP